MISSTEPKYSSFTSAHFVKKWLTRHYISLAGTFILSIVFGGIYLGTGGNAIAPIAGMCAIAVLVVAIQYPRSLFYIMLVGSILVETFFLNFQDSITDRIPLFWDVNSVVQTYAHKNDFHAVPLSVFEILMILSGGSWFIRAIYHDRMRFVGGPLLGSILLYVGCVFCGLLHGLASGGVFNIALFEVRAQFYFFFAYLLTVNIVKSPEKAVNNLLWTTAIVVGIKAVLASFRFVVTLKGTTIPEVGIGAHEESFFFDCFEVQLMVLSLAGVQPKLRKTMLWLLPFVLLANLANERRAATAGVAVTFLLLLAVGALSFPVRRRLIAGTAIFVAVVAAIYLPLNWNGTTTISQPARAIKSQFDPDERDALSNAYRDDENINLMFTMRQDPVFGYGYGKPFLELVPMIDLTSVDPFVHYMTHNQILWVWMRLGFIGFYCFWIMVCAVIIKGCQLLRNPNTGPEIKAAALLAVLIMVMQMIFGLLDLQISCMRNMLYCGIWAGTIACLATLYPPPEKTTVDQKELVYSRWNMKSSERSAL